MPVAKFCTDRALVMERSWRSLKIRPEPRVPCISRQSTNVEKHRRAARNSDLDEATKPSQTPRLTTRSTKSFGAGYPVRYMMSSLGTDMKFVRLVVSLAATIAVHHEVLAEDIVEIRESSEIQIPPKFRSSDARNSQPDDPSKYRTLIRYGSTVWSARYGEYSQPREADRLYNVILSAELTDTTAGALRVLQRLKLNDVIPFIDGFYRLEGLVMDSRERRFNLRLKRFDPPDSATADITFAPEAIMMAELPGHTAVIEGRESTSVFVRQIYLDSNGSNVATLGVANGGRTTVGVQDVAAGDLIRLRRGWHRIRSITRRSLRIRRPGAVELEARPAAPVKRVFRFQSEPTQKTISLADHVIDLKLGVAATNDGTSTCVVTTDHTWVRGYGLTLRAGQTFAMQPSLMSRSTQLCGLRCFVRVSEDTLTLSTGTHNLIRSKHSQSVALPTNPASSSWVRISPLASPDQWTELRFSHYIDARTVALTRITPEGQSLLTVRKFDHITLGPVTLRLVELNRSSNAEQPNGWLVFEPEAPR